MKKRHIFIAIDGVDGTFKTTVAKIIADDCHMEYYKTPNSHFSQFKLDINEHATPVERYCFFRLATQADSKQIEQLLKTKSVICDRYYASTYAYHVTQDERIKEIHGDEGILEPDFTFILDAKPEIRDQRIRARAKKINEPEVTIDSDFLNQVAATFKQLEKNYFYIDTSDLTSAEVALMIKKIIN